MQAFEIKTNKSDYPYLVIANGFKKAVELLYSKGVYDSDIISVQQLEAYKGDHILIEKSIVEREHLRKEILREIQETMPHWKPEPNGAAGGCCRDTYLIRTAKGYYFTASCIGGNNYYLELESLEQLPGLPKDD